LGRVLAGVSCTTSSIVAGGVTDFYFSSFNCGFRCDP
jgi:hypothetical protein